MPSGRTLWTWEPRVGDARLAIRWVAGLPFEQWAVRLSTGNADLRGSLEQVIVVTGGHTLTLGPGPAHVELMFLGGLRPRLVAVAVTTPLTVGTQPATSLRLVDGEVLIDDVALARLDAPLASSDLVTALLDNLSDVELIARGRPVRDARVRLPEGIEVRLSDRDEVTVQARTHGPPDDLVLSEPLRLQFGEYGVRVDHRSARWLAAIARVRINGAHLHPDGRVVLEGSAHRGLNHVVRAGLRSASTHLSGLVQKSPRFKRVRDFLRR
jgi:hypothetical protein